MAKNIIKEVSVRKDGHSFTFLVRDDGKIDYHIDNGKVYTAKDLKDGKIYFTKKQELVVKGELVEIGKLDLNEEDFAELKKAQDSVFEAKNGLSLEEHNDAFYRVDEWKKKVCYYKDKNNKKQVYCVHNFRIGNDKYRFLERKFPNIGVVINPDYKISNEMPDVGGVPKQYGELMFWDYFFEGEGWKKIRVLTNNELTCVDIIKKSGYFATGQDQIDKNRKKGLFSFFKK